MRTPDAFVAAGEALDAKAIELRRRDRNFGCRSARHSREFDDSVRSLDGQTTEQNGLKNAEHRARQPDREAQDQDDGHTECRGPEQRPGRKREIASSAVENVEPQRVEATQRTRQ